MEQGSRRARRAYHLFVGNMSTHIDEKKLAAMVAPFGTVRKVTVAKTCSADLTRRFGFVEMNDRLAAVQVVAELNQENIDGCCLRVRLEE